VPTLSKRILTLFILFIIAASTALACTDSSETVDPMERYWARITQMLNKTDSQFSKHISLIESTDSEGNPIYIGELDAILDSQLPSLIETFNADPETTEPVTIEEVRYKLTDGITEAAIQEDNPFWRFILWLGHDAELVYRDTGANTSGSHSNYSYSINKDSTLKNFCFRWEYELTNAQ